MTGLLEWNRPSHSYHTGLKHEKKRGKTAKINIFKKIFPLNLKILIYQIYANIFWRTFLVSICCGRQRLWRGGNNKVQPHFFYFLAYFLLWTFLCRQFWFFFSYMAFTWPFYLCSRGQENHRHDRGTMTSDCLDWNLTVICNCSWLRKNDVVSNSFSKVGSLMDHFLEGIALLRYKILVHQLE